MGFRVIMMCQWRLIRYNKCTTLVENVGNRRLCMCAGWRIWEISVPSSPFSVNLKLLPRKSLKKKSQGSVVELTAQPMFTGLTYFKNSFSLCHYLLLWLSKVKVSTWEIRITAVIQKTHPYPKCLNIQLCGRTMCMCKAHGNWKVFHSYRNESLPLQTKLQRQNNLMAVSTKDNHLNKLLQSIYSVENIVLDAGKQHSIP